MQKMLLGRCPGYYCGKMDLGDGNLSDCGACPRGYRSSEFSICEPCLDFPSAYDIRYLGFMALMLLVLEWYIIDLTTERQALSKKVLALHGSALLENILAMLLTVLLTAPVGSLDIHACRISYLADWYTLLYNPSPGYQHTLRCANEAAYPLYSMVFIHLSLCLLLMLVIRAGILARYISRAKQSVYLTMYLVPSLLLVHAVFAGLLYYTFPFILIISSVISVAYHLAFRLDQQIKSLVKQSVEDPRNFIIILIHWLLHGYGIGALTQHPALHALVPLPTIFYILTSRYTDPTKLHDD